MKKVPDTELVKVPTLCSLVRGWSAVELESECFTNDSPKSVTLTMGHGSWFSCFKEHLNSCG